MANFVMADTDKHYPNEANPSFNAMTESTSNSINEDFFTDPVINCPSNIVQTADAGQNTKTVSWTVPSATTPCIVSTGQNCPSDHISGFIFIGKLGGSKYYCSDNSNYNYWEAKAKAEQSGGYLAVICSSEENQFIRDGMSAVSNPADEAWIGLNDEASEGHFRWVNGSTCGYRNWASGEPNDEHNNSNYHGGDNVILHRNSGEWKDRNGRAKYEFVMEIPCDETTRPGNVTVAQIAGPAPGSSFAVGSTTTIRYRATDECGRSSECSFTVKVNAPADPCANNGGDSDGDGVCDDQDNCDFTSNPDQADNDGDGIGNVCDDTPNGEPCANNGGDSDGDGVCDDQDNCDFTSNPDQADNDGDGIGNVCDDTPNGEPCDNQGGDSDGDGVCDNQDNCDFNANPDQADNDGDGIGNVCDDTPNGGGNGGDCNSVTVAGESGKITISSIPSDAKVEYSGPSTNWGQELVCSANCSSMEMVSGLSAGDYTVTVQTFNPYCYNRVTVTVTGGGGGSPCDNQGGDSDGDGVCDNQDNCRTTPNPDQADNDNDGIGNVCDDTPNGGGNGGDCNSVTVAGESGKITISSIPSDAKVEYSGPSTNWGQELVCNANCSSMEMVSGLSAGDYTVTVQTFNPYCYNRVTVTVTGGGGPCDNQGGDSDGDGVCDDQDNCDFNANPDQADNDGDGIGNVCDDTPNGGGNGGDCNSVTVTGESGKITISSIPSDAKVEYSGPSTNWGQELVCNANCGSMEMVSGLSAGDYTVTVQTFNPYCYNRVTVTVTGGGGGPCDNQGGDSDGDGVCDNQDNCDFTANPDQADNDGDGIGNACDDTPNGPCGSQGGDSDGDGVCDNQDNCRTTPNPDQADNDNDGIGNVCDDTPNGEPTVCADRTVSNTNLCSGPNEGTRYGGYLLLDRTGDSHYISNNHYDFQNGKFVEYTDGTARLTGRWVNRGRSGVKFDVDIHFSGRTNNQAGKNHNCLNVDKSKFYFYTTTSGTLTGRDKMAGARLNVSRISDAFQVGVGANITHNQKTFGASGWLSVNIEHQPTTGINIYLSSGNSGQNGDININLSGDATACVGAGNRNSNLLFTAFEAQRQVALQWATNSTYRNDYYVIEKSTDGENFEALTKVYNEVFGLDMESFTQLDLTPQLGENYYRLKEVYLDGSFEYTATELINFNIDLEALEVYPNPVNKELFINMKQFVGKQAHILLMNQYGQLIQEVTLDEINEAPVRMEVGNIPNGIYLLTIQPGGGLRSVTKKLVVGKMY